MSLLAFIMGFSWLPIPSAVSTPRWIALGVGASSLLLVTRIQLTKAHWAGLAFLLYALVSCSWSFSPLDSAGEMMKLAAVATVFLVGASASIGAMEKFWDWLAAGASISFIIALFQFLGFELTFPNLDHSPVGTFGNKNFLANFGALAFLGILFNPPTWWRMPLVIGAAGAFLLPMSRGASLAVFLSLVIAKASRKLILVSLITSASALFIYFYLWEPGRLSMSVLARLEMWDWTISNFKWLGWGIGAYGSVFPFEHANNDYFEIIFETGLGSGILFLFVFLLIRWRVFNAEYVVLLAVLIEALTSFPLHQAAIVFVFAIVAGRIASMFYIALDPQPFLRATGSKRIDCERFAGG